MGEDLQFPIKYLGTLNYFLGVEVHRTTVGLFLSQKKYVADLLEHFGMQSAKTMKTPLSVSTKIHGDTNGQPADGKSYRSLVVGLQYLALTRPDIGFATNKLSQFMHSPKQSHWIAAKRLL